MMKRIISLILSLVLLISAVPVPALAAETHSGDISVEIPAAEVTVPQESEAPEESSETETVTEEAPAPLAETGETEETEETEPEDGIADQGQCSDSVSWVLTEDGTLTVSGTGPIPDYTDEEPAPWEEISYRIEFLVVEGGITAIGDNAFYGCPSLSSVKLGQNLQSIGNWAFGCAYSLSEISLPDGITAIGSNAFADCDELTVVKLPAKLESIGNEAFSDCVSLIRIDFPGSLKSIGNSAFAFCSGLESVTFAQGLQTIGEDAFRECEALTEVVLPKGLQTIGAGAFAWDTALTTLIFAEGLTDIGAYAFESCESLESLSFPKSLKTIGTGAFTYCEALEEAIFAEGLTTIEAEAFYSCASLKEVVLPKSLRNLGIDAFDSCGLTSLVISEGLETIGESAFSDCYELTDLTLPKTLKVIGVDAFSSCSELTNFTLPDGLQVIDEGAFSGCYMLTSLRLPKGITFIGDSAFDGCDELVLQVYQGSYGAYLVSELGLECEYLDSCAHSKVTHYEEKEATCLEKGNLEYWRCSKCGSVWEDEELEYLSWIDNVVLEEPHDLDFTEAMEATCEDDGNIAYWYCYSCETCWKDENLTQTVAAEDVVIPASHDLVHNKASAVTCLVDGCLENWYCNACETYWLDGNLTETAEPEDLVIPAGHEIEYIPAKAAGCFENGNLEHWHCTRCGIRWLDEALTEEVLDQQVFLSAFHEAFHVDAREADCYHDGNLEYWYCPVCETYWLDEALTENVQYGEVVLDAAHQVEHIRAKAASCKEDGNLEYWHCLLCKQVWLDEGLYNQSSLEEVILTAYHNIAFQPGKAASCYESGTLAHWYCLTCGSKWLDEDLTQGATQRDVTLSAGHDLVAVEAVEATCYEDGNLDFWYCRACETYWLDAAATHLSSEENVVVAAAHKINHVNAVTPTTYLPGNLEYWHCVACDKLWKDENLTKETTFAAVYRPALGLQPGDYLVTGECGKNAAWSYDTRDNSLTIKGYGAMEDYNDLEGAPWGEFIREIKTVTVEYGIADVGAYAFRGCEALTEVRLADSVRGIGSNAFQDCTSLSRIALPEGVLTLGAEAFRDCTALTDVYLSDTLQEIGSAAFYCCTSLTDIDLPRRLLEIGESAFEGCTALAGIVIPGNADIGAAAFRGCTAMTNVRIEDGVAEVSTSAFEGCTALRSLYLSDELTAIGAAAFADCTSLYLVSASEGLTTIEAQAFRGCTALKLLYLPESLISVGDSAFEGCTGLTALVLPEGMTAVGGYAFRNCTGLTALILPYSLETIGMNAFDGCTQLVLWVYRGSVGEAYALEYKLPYDYLENLPETCEHPLTVHVEAVAPTADEIGNLEYWYCGICETLWTDAELTQETDHDSVILPALGEPTDESLCGENAHWYFDPQTGTLTITGTGAMDSYSLSKPAPWAEHREQILSIRVEEGITAIGTQAFLYCANAARVSLPDSLKVIGSSAFMNSGVTQILLPDGLTELGADAFAGTKLDTIVIPSGITRLESGLFRYSTLKAIALPEGLSVIEDYAFYGSDLEAIYMPKTLRILGSEVFCGCTKLQTLKLNDGLLTMGSEVFGGCTALTELILPGTLTEMGRNVFTGCENLQLKVYRDSYGEMYATEYSLSYTYADPLPQAEKLALLGAGGKNITGQTLSVDMFYNRSFWFFPELMPEGSTAQVEWESSSAQIATVENGLVTPVKPGTVTITASIPGTKLSASVTLNITCLDTAKKLTADVYVPELGLQAGQSTTMTVYGAGGRRLDTAGLHFYTSDAQMATVNSKGVVTAGTKAGTVTVTAEIPNDPLGRQVSVKVKVIPAQVYSLKLTPVVNGAALQVKQEGDSYLVCLDKKDVEQKPLVFSILATAIGADGRVMDLPGSSLKWTSGESRIATVEGDSTMAIGNVTVLSSVDGVCRIKAAVNDTFGKEAVITILVKDYAPRLENSNLQLDNNMVFSAWTYLEETDGNAIESVSVYEYDSATKSYSTKPSRRLWVEYYDGYLSLMQSQKIGKGTLKLLLKVSCANGGLYEYKLNLKVVSTTPAGSFKQLEKFNLFYKDSVARFQLTQKKGYLDFAEIDFGENGAFRTEYDWETGILTVYYSQAYLEGDVELNTKGTMLMYFYGYEEPIRKSVTLSTENKAPKITLSSSSSIINTTLGGEMYTAFTVNEWSSSRKMEVEADFAQQFVSDNAAVLLLTEEALEKGKAGTAVVTVSDDNWTGTVELKHQVTLQTTKPAAKLGKKNLTVNTLFPDTPVLQTVTLNQSNLNIADITIEPTATNAKVRREAEKIYFEIGDSVLNNSWFWVYLDSYDLPKKGSYEFRVTVTLEEGDLELTPKTFKVTVEEDMPTVKFKTPTLKLNKYLGEYAMAETLVTVSDSKRYEIVGLEDAQWYDDVYLEFDSETKLLRAYLLNPDRKNGTQTLKFYPEILDLETGVVTQLEKTVSVKVQYYSAKPTVTLRSEGTLDAAQRDYGVLYSVKKFKDISGTPEDVRLEGEDAWRFQVGLTYEGDAWLMLRRNVEVQKKTYKLKLIFTIDGIDVSANISVKVGQSALDLEAVGDLWMYPGMSSPAVCTVILKDVDMLRIEDITLGSKTAKQFAEALGENGLIVDILPHGKSAQVMFLIQNPEKLTYGKNYTVYLEVTPEGNAANVKPTQLKLTVKTVK